MVSLLTELTKEHKVALSVIKTGHDQFTSGGSVSNHFVGRGIDIATVDGEIVRPNSIASRELAEAIADLPESIRPSEVGTPWSINAPGFFTDGAHQDHLHVAFDGEAPAGFASPVAPVAPAAVPTPEAAPVTAQPQPEVRESGVFASAAETAPASGSPTVGAIPAVEEQPAQAAAEVVAVTPPVPGGGPVAPVAAEDMANTNEGGKLHASEFDVQDAEGAPGAEGNLHAGYDLFARAGAPVRSPIEGTIVEVKASRGNSGQIFGGTVKVQGADGRVWVFRHVDPKGVVEGGKVTAGQEIASVTEWTGGTHHAHIELWKTLEGGYNVSNMEDPYVELQTAYAGGGTELPPDVHTAEPAGDEHAGHDHGGGGELAAAGAAVTPSAELEALLANPKLELPDGARADLASGKVDPRMVSLLTSLTKEHSVKLSVIITGHDQFTSGGSVSNHFVGRGIDIAAVDGEIVRPNSIASRELAEAVADLPESIRPTEVGTPWSINAPGFFTDGNHQDHLHIAYDGEAPAGFVSPVTPAAAPTPDVAKPVADISAAAPIPEPEPAAPEAPEVRESGVFAQVDEPAQGSNGGNTVQFMQAVKAEVKDKLQAAPEPDLEPVKIDSPAEAAAAAVVDGYPGDNAPKEQIAAWMATRAKAAGIPPELPVMAALVESRLSNINFGHADSIGFFQMRTSIWDQGEYAGYGQDPEKQIKWFLDHAVHEKNKRVEDGYTNFLTDETKWGDWVADVERPAEEYRGRYQEQLAEARALLAKSAACLDQALADGLRDRLRACAGVQLRDHVVDHVLDRPLAVAELLGDLARGVAGRDQPQHLLLARRQPRERQPARLEHLARDAGDSPQEVAEDLGRHHAGAVRGAADAGLERLGRERVLAEIADGAGLHGREHVLFLGARGADHDGGPRLLAHLADEVASAGDVGVDEHHLGVGQAPARPRLAHGPGLGHVVHVGHALQAGGQAVPVDRVGIEDEDLHPVPSGRTDAIRPPGPSEPQEHTTFAASRKGAPNRVFESSADCPRLGRAVRVA